MILFGVVFIAVIGLTIYALSLFRGLEKGEKDKKDDVLAAKELDVRSKERKILELEEQINSLRLELEKSRIDYANLQNELEVSKLKEADLKAEIERREEWVAKGEEMLDKTKEQKADLNGKITNKEKELQTEFEKNVKLTRELRDEKEKFKSLEEENQDKTELIEILKSQVEQQINVTKKYSDMVSELKKKQEASDFVPKAEFNKLNEEYTNLEEELENKDKKIKRLSDEIGNLNNKLKEIEKHNNKQVKQESVESATKELTKEVPPTEQKE